VFSVGYACCSCFVAMSIVCIGDCWICKGYSRNRVDAALTVAPVPFNRKEAECSLSSDDLLVGKNAVILCSPFGDKHFGCNR
jgi:hypothetical protein